MNKGITLTASQNIAARLQPPSTLTAYPLATEKLIVPLPELR
jgi:hypothetical protein